MDNVLFEIRQESGKMQVVINPVLPEVLTREKLAELLDDAAKTLREKAERRRKGQGLSEGKAKPPRIIAPIPTDGSESA